jgi:hypothetical protein
LDGALHQTHYAAFRLISYIDRNDPILQEPCDEDEDELDEDELVPEHGTEVQEGENTSEGEFEVSDLEASSDQESDGSKSCLALLTNSDIDEASSMECNEADQANLYITHMHPTDIITVLSPNELKQVLTHVSDRTDREIDRPEGLHHIWISIADPIITIRFMAIIKGLNDVEQIDDQFQGGTEGLMKARSKYTLQQLYKLHIAVRINISEENHLRGNEEAMHPTPQLIHELSQIELIRII